MKTRVVTIVLLFLAIAGAMPFDMVVLGDRTSDARQDVFETILQEARMLKPDLLMNVGDLVQGYTRSRDTLEMQWDSILRQLKSLNVTFHLTPGNHDITDAMAESVWTRRFGARRYSFTYNECHFLVIDNSRWDSAGAMAKEDLDWIDRDLQASRPARRKFVFMHRSFWLKAFRRGVSEPFHDIFRKYGVNYVFSGHDHYYCSTVKDGITYIQLGPSGSRYKEYNDPDRGAFQNYLVVRVGDSAVRITVVKPGSLLPADCVTLKDEALLDSIDQLAVRLPVVKVRPLNKVVDSLVVPIRNVTGNVLASKCVWTLEGSNWHIEPETMVVVCNPGVTTTNEFAVRLAPDANPYPLPELTMPYAYGAGKLHNLDKLLPIQRSAVCPTIAGLPVLDGKLNDRCWKRVKPLKWYGGGAGGIQPTDPFDFYLAHNDTMLFIAARCTETEMDRLAAQEVERDGMVANDDNLNLLLCPDSSGAVYYQLIVNPLGTIWDRKIYKDGSKTVRDNKWNADWQLASSKGDDFWTLEVAVPLKDFEPNTRTWGFNLVRFQARNKAVAAFQAPFVHDSKQFAMLQLQ